MKERAAKDIVCSVEANMFTKLGITVHFGRIHLDG
jgi:hypothetical protein